MWWFSHGRMGSDMNRLLLPPIQIRSVSAGYADLRLTTAANRQTLVNAQSACWSVWSRREQIKRQQDENLHVARHFCKLRINLSPRTPGCPYSLKTDGVRTLTTMSAGLRTADKSSGSTNPACSSSWFSALAVVTSRATVASRLLPPIQTRSVSAGCADLRLTTTGTQ